MGAFLAVLIFATLSGAGGYFIGFNRGSKGLSRNPFKK